MSKFYWMLFSWQYNSVWPGSLHMLPLILIVFWFLFEIYCPFCPFQQTGVIRILKAGMATLLPPELKERKCYCLTDSEASSLKASDEDSKTRSSLKFLPLVFGGLSHIQPFCAFSFLWQPTCIAKNWFFFLRSFKLNVTVKNNYGELCHIWAEKLHHVLCDDRTSCKGCTFKVDGSLVPPTEGSACCCLSNNEMMLKP